MTLHGGFVISDHYQNFLEKIYMRFEPAMLRVIFNDDVAATLPVPITETRGMCNDNE